MYAHFELLVVVDRFRNLDLFHQGEYSIGCRVFGEKTRVAARPVQYIVNASGEVMSTLSPPKPSQYPGGINDEDSAFRSSSFYVRYREETRMISEAVVFHIELPVPNDFLFEPIILQFELLFQKPIKARALPQASDGGLRVPRLQGVATHQWRHHPSATGGHGHCHLTFDDMHSCVVEAYASSSLLYYTAGLLEEPRRIFPLQLEEPKKKSKKDKDEDPTPPPPIGVLEKGPFYYAAMAGATYPAITTSIEMEIQRRQIHDMESQAPRSGSRPGTARPEAREGAGQARTGEGRGGGGGAGGVRSGAADARSDRYPRISEVDLDFVMQCLSTLSCAEESLSQRTDALLLAAADHMPPPGGSHAAVVALKGALAAAPQVLPLKGMCLLCL